MRSRSRSISLVRSASWPFRCRDAADQRNGQLAERTKELERLLDRMLMA